MRGAVVLIGGSEDKDGECHALGAVATAAPSAPLLVVTAASRIPHERSGRYERCFCRLGVGAIAHLHLTSRDEASRTEVLARLDDAGVVFFTGGSQNVLAERLIDTPFHERLLARVAQGMVVAGTSAGASILGDPMPGAPERRTGARTAAGEPTRRGLGVLPNVIVDQHFAERQRQRRLARAVHAHAGCVGVGLDEDTALVLDAGGRAEVLGRGAVWLYDSDGGEPLRVAAPAQRVAFPISSSTVAAIAR